MPDPIQVAIMGHTAITSSVLRFCLEQQPDLRPVDLGKPGTANRIDIFLVHALLPYRLRSVFVSLAQSSGRAKPIVFGASPVPLQLAGYLQQGFCGYVKRGTPLDGLLDVIRDVSAGEFQIEGNVMRVILEDICATDRAPVIPLREGH